MTREPSGRVIRNEPVARASPNKEGEGQKTSPASRTCAGPVDPASQFTAFAITTGKERSEIHPPGPQSAARVTSRRGSSCAPFPERSRHVIKAAPSVPKMTASLPSGLTPLRPIRSRRPGSIEQSKG